MLNAIVTLMGLKLAVCRPSVPEGGSNAFLLILRLVVGSLSLVQTWN